ncbi:hypothetical protein LMG28614_05529 [Paraburkholderia ultramafica]|uniref:PAAR motif-containing protein n=2 Tax=Paraburkholderia ultramafica TaxID=1544867 RepID=A0A6S7BJ64_9BURK|nr:hypothetical protein LMG28614_05529 [Paraburkholderia ultramafica]
MSKQEPKGTLHRFATVGALTERGGRVSTGYGSKICGLPIARVGDIVTYSDGSEAAIIDGAGYAAVFGDHPAALVGSRLTNGDRIIETPWGHLEMGVCVPDDEPVPGLFDANWTPPPRKPLDRFAVRGATTARGGIVREVSSLWEVERTHRKAASIGDFVEYQDGSRARIITGIGIPGNEQNRYAVVGSLLDNGDVITDSPHREPQTSTIFVPIDEHGAALAAP